MFKRIMDEKPEVMKKIYPVWGEITQVNLSLSEEHLKYVTEKSQIVFHFAASLKLEASLRHNVLMNLTGTQNVLKLAKEMKNLAQIVHLSTAFCCEDVAVLHEKVYDHPHDPMDLMRCAEWMNDNAMAAMQAEVLGTQPNTYTYTKRLSELLVRSEYDAEHFPICIVRPSIVSPAYQEPLPGWVTSLKTLVFILINFILNLRLTR